MSNQYNSASDSHTKLLSSDYDGFFKYASGPDIADKADGNVEAPCGWFAQLNIKNDTAYHETVEAVRAAGYEGKVPDPGFYVTVENNQGLIFVYEFSNRWSADDFYSPFEAVYEAWDHEDDEEDKYVWIKAWCQLLGSAEYYLESELAKAVETDAPISATHSNLREGTVQWNTLEHVTSVNTRQYFKNWAENHNIELPESVQQAWGLIKNA